MIPDSPAQVLERHAAGLRDVLVGTVRLRHARFTEAHQVSESRYVMQFGSRWRDLLDDTAGTRTLPVGHDFCSSSAPLSRRRPERPAAQRVRFALNSPVSRFGERPLSLNDA